MKIIDFERKGNLVRFYLGDDDLVEWYGDDWNDTPYEHNAERVYFADRYGFSRDEIVSSMIYDMHTLSGYCDMNKYRPLPE